MAFIYKIFCEDCGEEVANVFKHGPDVCLEKRKAEYKSSNALYKSSSPSIFIKVWEKEYKRVEEAWEAWKEETGGLEHCLPSVQNTPDEIAHHGWCVLFDLVDFPSQVCKHYISGVIENPTWGDVAREFDKAISMTGDHHHCYMKGLYLLPKASCPDEFVQIPSGVSVLRFRTGSQP